MNLEMDNRGRKTVHRIMNSNVIKWEVLERQFTEMRKHREVAVVHHEHRLVVVVQREDTYACDFAL